MDKEILKNGESGFERKRPNFFYWYYNDGIRGLLEIWKNFLLFVWHGFSIFRLLRTLLSPWRRDVIRKNWRGFHPLLMLEIFTENLLSCLIGAIVRFFVICSGIFVFLATLVFGIVATFVWISAPLLLAAVLFFLSKNPLALLTAGGTFLFFLILVIIF